MMFAKLILALTVMAVACCAQPAVASHPYHVSMAEIEYNPTRKTFEIALCVWPEDLQKAVSKMENKSFNIDSATEKDRDELFKKYVAQKFRFLPSNKTEKDSEPTPASIRWVGSELSIKKGWLYFEVDGKAASDGWRIENQMFFELNEDQLNLVQVMAGKRLESRTLSAGQPSLDWSTKTESKKMPVAIEKETDQKLID